MTALAIDVHHIDEDPSNNDPSNLIALCPTCHNAFHRKVYAVEAIRRAGLTPVKTSIRGGTDGSRLSFMGLPCPNIFAGEHAFHSRLEWVSRQDMEKAVETIVHLAAIWEERA